MGTTSGAGPGRSASFSVIYHHQDWGCGRRVGGAGKKKVEGHIVLWKLSKGMKKLELFFPPSLTWTFVLLETRIFQGYFINTFSS